MQDPQPCTFKEQKLNLLLQLMRPRSAGLELRIRGTKKVSPLMNPKVMKMLSPEGSSGSPCVSDTSQNQSKLLSTLGDWRTQTVESTISMRLTGPLHDKLFF